MGRARKATVDPHKDKVSSQFHKEAVTSVPTQLHYHSQNNAFVYLPRSSILKHHFVIRASPLLSPFPIPIIARYTHPPDSIHLNLLASPSLPHKKCPAPTPTYKPTTSPRLALVPTRKEKISTPISYASSRNRPIPSSTRTPQHAR